MKEAKLGPASLALNVRIIELEDMRDHTAAETAELTDLYKVIPMHFVDREPSTVARSG